MNQLLKSFLLICVLTVAAFAQRSPSDLNQPIPITSVNAATFETAPIAKGSIVAGFGVGFISAPTDDISIRYMDSAGYGVTLKNTVFAITPNQINYQMVENVSDGEATISFINSTTGKTFTGKVTIVPASPGIFTMNSSGKGVPAAVVVRVFPGGKQINEPVAEFSTFLGRFEPKPIVVNDDTSDVYLSLYGTGWRNATSPQTASIYIGGYRVPMQYFGATGGFLGLDQINVLVPKGLPSGRVSVVVIVDGKPSNVVEIAIQ